MEANTAIEQKVSRRRRRREYTRTSSDQPSNRNTTTNSNRTPFLPMRYVCKYRNKICNLYIIQCKNLHKYVCKLIYSYSAFHTTDLFDSLYVAQEFAYAWMNIKILLGLFYSSEENFGKTSSYFEQNTSLKNNSDEKEINNSNYDKTYMLKRSCVARVICLSNQKTTYLKNNTLAAIMSETLR